MSQARYTWRVGQIVQVYTPVHGEDQSFAREETIQQVHEQYGYARVGEGDRAQWFNRAGTPIYDTQPATPNAPHIRPKR